MADFNYVRPEYTGGARMPWPRVDVASAPAGEPEAVEPRDKAGLRDTYARFIEWLTVVLPREWKAMPWRWVLAMAASSAGLIALTGGIVVQRVVKEAERTVASGGHLFPVVLEHVSPAGGGAPRTLFSGTLDRSRMRSMTCSLREMSPHLLNAVLSIEDRRFRNHRGIDWIRTSRAAIDGLISGDRPRGTSSITQQLARNVYLDRRELWRRKLKEAAIAIVLERKFSKDEILERYLNYVPLGHHASYDIAGVGLASQVYFGKHVRDLTLSEAALLAGMIQAPSRYRDDPDGRNARRRRSLVLAAMKRDGWITAKEFAEANNAPIKISGHDVPDASDYFVDAVNRELKTGTIPTGDGARIRTTIDLRLQRVLEHAAEQWGAKLEKRFRRTGAAPQLAIVALDPSSGAIRAIAGGKSFEASQLNHAFAKRPPGSLFKAFVYATALHSSVQSGSGKYSPETLIDDSPIELSWRGELYAPGNFQGSYRGEITLQEALNVSANAPAVRLAEEVGFQSVAKLAKAVGLKSTEATPSAALGSYEVTPIELAGAYAVFANGGYAVEPHTVESVVAPGGQVLFSRSVAKPQVLDPRAAYMMARMLQGVVLYGTAWRARSLGVVQPAGGKTGTTRDSWFAGFTSNLVCVVWVGFDDYRDLKMTGADGALPIWADVMKQAAALKPYSDAKDFRKPSGAEEVLARARERKEQSDTLPAR